MSSSIKMSTKRLRDLVAGTLAKAARNERRKKKKDSYSPIESRNILEIESLLLDEVHGKWGSVPEEKLTQWWSKRWATRDTWTKPRIVAALKFWGNRVHTERRGKSGNYYRWVLKSEKNEWDRRKRKREEYKAKRKKEDEERERETKKTQEVADRLAIRMGWEAGTLKAWDENININRRQALSILCKLPS